MLETPPPIRRSMIGYHYTSLERWKEIQKTGLVPQLIYNEDLLPHLDVNHTHGIWLWKQDLTPRDELGIVLFVLAHRASIDIVKLSVDYTHTDTLDHAINRNIKLTHSGNIEKLPCYLSEPQSVVLTQAVSPSRIQLLKTFNLMDITNNEYHSKKA